MLSPEASALYYEGAVISHDHGFASSAETHQRLAFLFRNTSSEDLRKRLDWLPSDVCDSESSGSNEPDVSIEIDTQGMTGDQSSVTAPYGWPSTPPLLFRFFVAGVAGAKQWEFNRYDRDYFPSIPHGHHTSFDQKLDVYRGWIYRHADQTGREPRKLIIAIWNNDKFRDLARDAILFYMTEYPRYRWRVSDPSRLPRRH